MTEEIILWGATTGRSMRVHWVLQEFDLPYETKPIGPRTGETQTAEYLAINPKGKVPTLQHADLTLTESVAILSYVTQNFNAPSDFFVPNSRYEKARSDELTAFIAMELDAHPLYTMRRHGDLHKIYGSAPAVVDSAKEYFLKQFHAVVPDTLKNQPYLMGNTPGTVDILLLTCIDWALNYKIELPPPTLDYQQRLHARKAYQAAYRRCYLTD